MNTSAVYYEWMHVDDLSGIFVRGIAEGCAAALDRRIKVHDQIIAVRSVVVTHDWLLFRLPGIK